MIHYLTNFIMNQHNDQSTAPVSQRSLVHIPYRPEFSGLIFTTATVVFITAKISFIFKLILKVNQQEKKKKSLVVWCTEDQVAPFPLSLLNFLHY